MTYTALGPKAGLPKERIEVFGNGEAWIVDDFKSLTRASDGSVLWSSSTADKGHFEEMRRLGDCLAEEEREPDPYPPAVRDDGRLAARRGSAVWARGRTLT